MSFGIRDLRATSPESRRGGERLGARRDDRGSVAVSTPPTYGEAVDRDDALARVRGAHVGRLATVAPEGRPHVVPFVFALIERRSEVRVYWVVDRKPKRTKDLQRIRNLERNAAVEFVVDGYDEDWTTLWWVRCSGSARVVTDDAERRDALGALRAKYPPYELEPPDGPVIAIDVQTVVGWAADEAPSPGDGAPGG
jgi:PPOX class probable F420-dependent enzyme